MTTDLTRKILFVGEVNPYGGDPSRALYDLPHGATGDRLRRLVLGLSRDTYFSPVIERRNLCVGKWSLRQARAAADGADLSGRDLVLLGRKVATAFGFSRSPLWTVTDDGTVILPHPSGLCREWNVPGAFERARALLRSARPDVPWGELVETTGGVE